jgi:lipoprotein-anchoring transpeptidase ErfK/SrfK
VGIHGKGNSPDWTLGCIALSDEDIKILWRYVPLKTKVDIYK